MEALEPALAAFGAELLVVLATLGEERPLPQSMLGPLKKVQTYPGLQVHLKNRGKPRGTAMLQPLQ